MSNREKYNDVFVRVFNVEVEKLNQDFNKENVSQWDSVIQLSLVSDIEDTFDVMFEPEEIMDCTSYERGIALLVQYGVEI